MDAPRIETAMNQYFTRSCVGKVGRAPATSSRQGGCIQKRATTKQRVMTFSSETPFSMMPKFLFQSSNQTRGGAGTAHHLKGTPVCASRATYTPPVSCDGSRRLYTAG